MFFPGGFPFGDAEPQMHSRRRRDVNNTKFYQVLGIDKNASENDIKKAYRKLAIKHHPDKGGDQEVFKELCRAYEVLSDPEKRRTYDQFGEEGLDNAGASDPSDIFDLFFRGGRPKRSNGKRKGEDIDSPIKVTLEQVYNGASRRMAISKDVICDACEGHGGPKEAIETCSSCNGTSVRVHIRQIGPVIQQTQAPCHSCRNGKVIAEQNKCKKCGGIGTCKERKLLEVYIEKGVPDGHVIVFTGEADEKPDTIPGDIRFTVHVMEHNVFARQHDNLLLHKTITLYEALTGYQFIVQHLDGRKLLIKSGPNETTEPGSVKAIASEGLPVYKNPFEKGHLLIEFTVKMPLYNELRLEGAELKKKLKKVLPVPTSPKIDENHPDVEHHVVTDVTEEMQSRSQPKESYFEEDNDDGNHKVQCRQQ